MDREISQQEVARRRTKLWYYAALALIVILGAAWLMRRALSNTVKRSEIRTAIVETGDIENTLTAIGEVQPEFEQVITSPISAVLQQVYINAGTTVKPGDKILELDKVFTQLEFEKQKDELELKRNGIVKIKLELDKSFFDIKIQDSIKACQITSFKADLENAKRLFKAGGGTREAIEKAETNLQIAQLEKRQLENDIRSRQAVMQAGIRESEISASIQEKGLREFERKLSQAEIIATRAGVLTYVNASIGAKIDEGESLARIADLASFKILGSISDSYASQLQVGMPIIIRLNDSIAQGTLLNIRPSVTNNVINFEVTLNDRRLNSQLRPKMKVELYAVTDAHKNAIRVSNGPAFNGSAAQDVFVLTPNGKAERRSVKIGMSNFNYVEILSGLNPGEKVIISDMSVFKHVKEVEVK
jgi:HlyD family secretion protein